MTFSIWPFKKQEQSRLDETPPPIKTTLRGYEIEKLIERGYLVSGNHAGAFLVVAELLAEQEARIAALEAVSKGMDKQ